MNESDMILEANEGYGILTLNRPETLNAITARMLYQGFEDIFDRIRKDEDIRALIITGSGGAFCSGLDISAFDALSNADTQSDFFKVYGDFALKVRNLHKPIIAAINGMAAGGGLTLAVLSDIRIASENARFSAIWVKRGIVPDCGTTFFLPRIIGFPKAMELMITGAIIDAGEAEKIGLVSKVVSADILMQEAKHMASEFAKGPSLALGLIRQAVYSSMVNDLEQQMFFETAAVKRLWQTHDCREAARAFVEKRPPRFLGK
jgi:2-(1,2-epoxy-1,2-dihydrophenyl)acetyl-CoA isomerase